MQASSDGSFLGVGWHFPIQLDGDRIAIARHEESIRQSIWIILGTAKGERTMRPDFGCGLHDLVFAVNDETTASRAAGSVKEALLLWEPRIDVIKVQAGPHPEGSHALLIEISYCVRVTNNVFNLVYPFYLDKG